MNPLQCYRGREVLAFLPQLASLRMQVFREYPYCYDGDAAYEARYLQVYANAPDSFFAIFAQSNEVLGATTAIPLLSESRALQLPFLAHGFDPATVFYFGESVLLPAYRRRGIGHAFFDAREAFARELKTQGYPLRWLAFASVDRAPDDARQPADYRDNTQFWRKRGFEPHARLKLEMSWREVEHDTESPHTLSIWLKPLL